MPALYHSRLKGMTEEGPVEARVESDVLESKFKRGTYYVKLRIDRQVFDYTCDTQDIEDAFKNLKGKTVEIVAGGSRENPDIEVTRIDGRDDDRPARDERRSEPRGRSPQRRSEPSRSRTRTTSRREEPEPEEDHDSEPEPPKKTREQKLQERADAEKEEARTSYAYGSRAATLMIQAAMIVQARVATVYAALGYDPTNEDIRALSNTLFIEMKGYTDVHKLPIVHPLEAEVCGQSHQAAPAREQRQEPAAPAVIPQHQRSDNDGYDQGGESDIPF